MKSKKIIFIIIFLFGNNIFAKELVDKIVVRVNGANILNSDLNKPRLAKGGQAYELQEAITEELFFQKAAERKLLTTESEIEKQIVSLKIQNGMADVTDQEFEEQLKKEGFSLNEYKYQMAKLLAIEKFKQAEFNERVVVTNQQIDEYHKNNPEYAQAEYKLKICVLSDDQLDINGEIIKKDNLKWEDLGWVKKKDLSKNLLFVCDMNNDEVSKPVKIKTDYQIIKLEDKKEEHLRTLDERRTEIERLLQDKKKEKFEKELVKDLESKSSIICLT
ncbi:hypothetical protein K9L05_04075 [Candidatus Babeliales bacterium]|nr:hypothetical protein [Candidatus Babeliales bacterium]MCF7899793.1 hypothetical protein [Candidatus Babeliales bacterium]